MPVVCFLVSTIADRVIWIDLYYRQSTTNDNQAQFLFIITQTPSTQLHQPTTVSIPSKMANTKPCWICWKQRLYAILGPLFYLTACYLCVKAEMLCKAHVIPHTLFYAAYYLASLKLLISILTLLNRPAWYDEDAPDDHCHYRDTPEKMAAQDQRVQEELAIFGRRFQDGVREPFFQL